MTARRRSTTRSELEQAHGLISAFKEGAIEAGTPIDAHQERLIRLLAADLQVAGEDGAIEPLVHAVARADTHWNHRTMAAVIRYYDLRKAGSLDEAEQVREAFLSECPSTSYRDVVSNL